MRARSTAAVATLLFAMAAPGRAVVLAREQLLAPLAPERSARLVLSMPASFAPDRPVWVAYDVVALSPDADDDDVDLGVEQSFEGVMTPATAMFVMFRPSDFASAESAGTIPAQLERLVGNRDPSELSRLLGPELSAAYRAVNAGSGRILSGRLLRELPPPGRSDAPLLITVARAAGLAPLAVVVTVGQGPLPPELQQDPKQSPWYRAGYFGGLALAGWLVLRWVRRRRRDETDA